ncbi:MAG: hypothetical protein Q4F00_11490 [bacterium]|nr:hypothetical protein [bacterium]
MDSNLDILGLWIGAALSLCIFSFLYRDNPLYRLAEHVFVGVSAGYCMCVGYWQVLHPNLIARLQQGDWRYAFAAVLGTMLLLRLWPKYAWMGRWPLAFMVGIYAGYNIVYTMQAQVLAQIGDTILKLWGNADWTITLKNWLILIGVLSSLTYFYFSVEHKGIIIGNAARVGIWVLMITFGATFGYTVMARVSLLVGRVMFFQDVWMRTARWLGVA